MKKGKWFHSFNDDGDVEWQGQILSVSSDCYNVQLYSWIDGSPTDVRTLGKDVEVVFYDTNEEMREARENLR